MGRKGRHRKMPHLGIISMKHDPDPADDKQHVISDSFLGVRHMTGCCGRFTGERAGSFLRNQAELHRTVI